MWWELGGRNEKNFKSVIQRNGTQHVIVFDYYDWIIRICLTYVYDIHLLNLLR
jgi:hypothetical protein